MQLTIDSRILGKKLTFSRPRHYIYLDANGHSGMLGKQICSGGGFLGDALSCGDDQAAFERICRNWYRAYTRDYKAGHYLD